MALVSLGFGRLTSMAVRRPRLTPPRINCLPHSMESRHPLRVGRRSIVVSSLVGATFIALLFWLTVG